MTFSCLSVIRQGWLGLPLFLLGIVSLAFSQLAQTEDNVTSSAEELVSSLTSDLNAQSERMSKLDGLLEENPLSSFRETVLSNLEAASNQGTNSDVEVERLKSNLNGVEDAWAARKGELTNSIQNTNKRLLESKAILNDLKDEFAGRLGEAQIPLQVLKETASKTENESIALEKLMDAARKDAIFGIQSLVKESEQLNARTLPTPPAESPKAPNTTTGRNVSAVIRSSEAVPLSTSDRFSPSIVAAPNILTQPPSASDRDGNSEINRLESQLAASKNIQTELSEDTAQMQIELRKAYRDIVSLRSNLKESEQMVSELQKTKNALSSNNLGSQGISAKSITDQINRLERELDNARSDLRQSRQSLLMEQERSNSYIRSITTELERTRRELDNARSSAINAGVDSARLIALEQELAQAKNALSMAKSAPLDADSKDFLDLQDELRKALGEIARMQVEIGEKNELENQLLQLKSSLADASESPSRSASPAYVNKLLLDLNAAKKEVLKAKEENRVERNSLAERVQGLEDQLTSSKLALTETQKKLDETQKQMAKREFDFANTIQSLEEDAQVAQEALREASLGKLPAIPFVNEMEQNLADSETRIQELSIRFESEQARATEVIDGLRVELDNALLSQKRALEQLSRRELELKGKDEELNLVLDEKQQLNEELQVVKVIAGQLQDLNQVLEETKDAQNKNNISTDQVVLSLRDELNKAKVELVFEREENDKIQSEAALQIANLEQQLVETHNKLLLEQESLVNQTDETQDLVLDLKSELDKAREEIARMKTAGLGESVETRQAVSQLQEALGTIRILKESLEEAEIQTLEVDNLKSELADAMSTQINTIQKSATEKNDLLAKISDLEAEIMIMREEGKGASFEAKKMVAQLNENLKESQKEIDNLQKRLENSDDSSVTAVIAIEEELLEANAENASLRAQLETVEDEKMRTIQLLENELGEAVAKLDGLEKMDSDKLIQLSDENKNLLIQLEAVEQNKLEEINALEEDLAKALKEKDDAISEARELLSRVNKDESSDLYAQLQSELNAANARLKDFELSQAQTADDSELNQETINSLENELADALLKLNQANDSKQQLDVLTKKLESANTRIDSFEANQSKIVDSFDSNQEVIDTLEGELADAMAKLKNANDQVIRLLDEKESLATEIKLAKSGKTTSDNEKIAKLQSELAISLKRLSELEDKQKDSSIDSSLGAEALQKLEAQLASSEATVSELQEKLSREKIERTKILDDFKKAGDQIAKLEALKANSALSRDANDSEAYSILEEQLVSSQLEVETLRQQNELEEQGRIALEKRLEKALSVLAAKDSQPALKNEVLPQTIADLKAEISTKDKNILSLKEQLLKAIEDLALRESEIEMIRDTTPTSPLENNNSSHEAIVAELNTEILNLRDALAKAKDESLESDADAKLIESLQDQLREAVAEGLDLEVQLEETNKQLQNIEQNLADSDAKQFDEIIRKAKEAETVAFEKIRNLTDALRQSEELRKETEKMLDLVKNQPKPDLDITKDPRFQELQIEISTLKQELSDNDNNDVLKDDLKEANARIEKLRGLQDEMQTLQKDLLAARDLEDPRVAELQNQLEISRDDALKLNIEFKNAMEEFGRIKDQVTSLENENARLRDVSLNTAKSEANKQHQSLQNRINALSNENANLTVELGARDNRLRELREQLVAAQSGIPALTADSAALNGQIIRLEGLLEKAEDNKNAQDFRVDELNQQLAFSEKRAQDLQQQLINAQSELRNLPSRSTNTPSVPPITSLNTNPPTLSPLAQNQLIELQNLREANKDLQSQLNTLSNRAAPDRALIEEKMRELNQRNMSAQIQLDRERNQVQVLMKELEDAQKIKQEVLDRGKSDAMKVELLNDELAASKDRVQSLERALISAREAIRVLQSGGGLGDQIQVSMPRVPSTTSGSPNNVYPLSQPNRTFSQNRNFSSNNQSGLIQPRQDITFPKNLSTRGVQNISPGESTLSLTAEVQFLNNRKRPAGFTEFFLVNKSLDQILSEAGLKLPVNEGIESYAELWARSVQRGYRFPGIAASIRNALASESLMRIKTNSIGEASVSKIKAGNYHLVGASTLGQVGVVWSKSVDLVDGRNNIALSLRDAAWAE